MDQTLAAALSHLWMSDAVNLIRLIALQAIYCTAEPVGFIASMLRRQCWGRNWGDDDCTMDVGAGV
jgi:hypothetical protein